LLALLVCLSTLGSGCTLLTPRGAPQASYTIALPEAGRPRVVVQARWQGLAAGELDLALLRRWGGYGGLEAQLTGLSGSVPLQPGPAGADLAHWTANVPRHGTLEVEYELTLSGRDGEIPSQVGAKRALLLMRSLILFPTAWWMPGQALTATLPMPVQITVRGPEDWPLYTRWPTTADGQALTPRSLEELLDGALLLGQFESYALAEGDCRAQLLLTPSADHAETARRAYAIGRSVLAAYRLLGSAPNGETAFDALVFGDEAATASAPVAVGDTGVPVAVGMVASGNTLLLRGDGRDAEEAFLLRQALRLWNGGALRTAPPWSPQAERRMPWLTLGWSEALAWRTALEGERVSPLQYWEQARRVAHTLAADPRLSTLSLAQAAAQWEQDATLGPFITAKAHLAALLLDARLRAASGGQADLSLALRLLLERANRHEGYEVDEGQLASVLASLGGVECPAYYRALIEQVGAYDLRSIPPLATPVLGERRAFRSDDGLTLVYQWVDGPGARAAIYLHDGPGRTPYDFLYQAAPTLHSVLDVAYLDQRGSGRSAAPGASTYSLDATLNDIELLRQQLAVDKVTLIGHAWGGYLALLYALRYPERVEALILLAPIPSFPDTVEAELRVLRGIYGEGQDPRALEVRRLTREGVHNYEDLVALERLLELSGAYGPRLAEARTQSAVIHARYEELFLLPAGMARSNEALLPALLNRDRLLDVDLLARGTLAPVPTLLLRGEQDQVVPPALLAPLQHKLNAALVTIPNAGYYLYLDNPAATLAAITAFLR
jgi:pimeloyl-ACP methyl ester carboxylesterase